MEGRETQQLESKEKEIDLSKVDLSWLVSLTKQFDRQSGQDGSPETGYKKLTLEDIEGQAGDILESTGLGVEIINEESFDNSGGSEDDDSIDQSFSKRPEMRVNLTVPRGKFVKYLRALSTQTISSSQIEGLNVVLESLKTQLLYEYDLDNPSDGALTLLADLGDIIEECIRLDLNEQNGLSIWARGMDKYLEMTKMRCIKEYLLAHKNELTEETDTAYSGPQFWHPHMSSGEFDDRWSEAEKVLEVIKKNPYAEGVYSQTVRHLKKSLRFLETKIKGEIEDAKHPLMGVPALHAKEDIEDNEDKIKIIARHYKKLEDMEE